MNTLQKTLLLSSFLFIYSCGSDSDPEPPPENTAPVANDDEATVTTNTATEIDVLANDTDEDGDTLTIAEVGDAEFGTLAIENDMVVYVSAEGYTGTDTFTYTVSDGEATDTATVTVTVTAEMAVSGRVVDAPIADATVTVTIGEETFTTTADADGYYTLDISFVDGSQLLTISTQGAEANDQGYVTLVSALDSLNSLYQAAGDDAVLERSEASGTNVTNVTTATFTLSSEANGGTPPATSEELETAQAAIDPDELLEIAAVIKLIVDNPNYEMPEGQTSIQDFVADTDAYNGFVEEVETNDPEALSNVVDEILADEDLVATTTELPEFYIQTFPTKPGYISQGSSVLLFNDDGTGETINREYSAEGNNQEFTWEIQEDGFVSITYNEPITFVSYPSIYDLTDDPEIIAAYEAQNNTQAEQIASLTSQRFKILSSGPRNDFVRTIEEVTYTYTPIFFDGQEYQIPSRSAQPDYQAMYMNGDKLELMEITEDDVVGNWALPLIANFNADTENTVYALDLITFNDDFTFTGELSGIEGTWELYEGLGIDMFYGDIMLSVEFVKEENGIYGALLSGETGNGARVAMYNWTAKQADDVSWNSDVLLTAADEVWFAAINAWSLDSWHKATGQPAINSFYGWQFENAEEGYFARISCEAESCSYGDDENTATDNFWVGDPMDWSLEENGYLQIRRYSSCDLYGDYVCRVRDWIPLLVDNENTRLVVLENAYYNYSGDPAGAYYSWFPPRLNYLQKIPFPDGISNPNYSDSGTESGAESRPGTLERNGAVNQLATPRIGFLPERKQPQQRSHQ